MFKNFYYPPLVWAGKDGFKMAKVEQGMEAMLEMYIFETNTLLDQLDEILLRTEEANVFMEDDINEIFRIMHTIKGSSAMMGFEDLQMLAHKGEDMFFIIRENPELAKTSPFVYELVFQVSDAYKAEVELIQNEEDYEPTDFSEMLIKLEEASLILKGESGMSADSGDANKQAFVLEGKPVDSTNVKDALTVRVYFEDGCLMENLRAFLLLNRIKEEAEVLSYNPPDVESNPNTAKMIVENGFVVTFRGYDGNSETVLKAIEGAVNVQSYEVINDNSANENLQGTQTPQAAPVQSRKPAGQQKVPADHETNLAKVQEEVKKAGGGQKQSLISVNLSKLDQLHDIVGEIITTESMVIANPDLEGLELESFQKAARQLRKLTEELQDTVMSIRMVPLQGVFQKMNRIIRDMKIKLNKDVELVIEGETTEVDKGIVDNLNDPLMHLVRNCMDHGVETTAEERIAKGKPAKATVTLSARNASGEVIIVVSDDGYGINCEKVLKKAAASGLLKKPENEYSEKEIQNMILLPGFSTNEEVTQFSGRGVGMDVVRQNIEKIGGTLNVESEEGRGTSFIIKIPLTLAIVDGMKLQVGDTIFTVPISFISSSFKVADNKIIKDTRQGEMIMIRGECYPILRLHTRFNMETEITDLRNGILILVETNNNSVCIFADYLIGEQPVVVKPFPKYLNQYNIKARGLSGCTIMGDGSISLIIDVNNLISEY